MISFKLDKDNNIQAGSGFLTVSDNKALEQDIKTSLSMWRGEYPFDITQGIDYLAFFRNQDRQTLLAEIAARVTSDPRVATADMDRSRSGSGLTISVKTTEAREVNVELD